MQSAAEGRGSRPGSAAHGRIGRERKRRVCCCSALAGPSSSRCIPSARMREPARVAGTRSLVDSLWRGPLLRRFLVELGWLEEEVPGSGGGRGRGREPCPCLAWVHGHGHGPLAQIHGRTRVGPWTDGSRTPLVSGCSCLSQEVQAWQPWLASQCQCPARTIPVAIIHFSSLLGSADGSRQPMDAAAHWTSGQPSVTQQQTTHLPRSLVGEDRRSGRRYCKSVLCLSQMGRTRPRPDRASRTRSVRITEPWLAPGQGRGRSVTAHCRSNPALPPIAPSESITMERLISSSHFSGAPGIHHYCSSKFPLPQLPR